MGVESLTASIQVDKKHSFEGRVRELESTAVVVEFPRKNGPTLKVTQTLELTLTAATSTMMVTSRVVSRMETPETLSYQFQISSYDGADLTEMIQRRDAFRARPGGHQTVPVSLLDEVGGNEVIGTLRDVSTNGLAVLVSPHDEGSFTEAWYVRIELTLPGESDPFRLVGTVRQRRLTGTKIAYGIQFDSTRIPDWHEEEKRLYAYVMRRQHEVVRCAKGGNAA